jgi:two-component system response regulator YesN
LRLFVNSSYLSRIFKQEKQQSFSDFVTECKMVKAKELLACGAKVFEAAELTGYRNTSYFARVFRKYWGVVPSGTNKI